MNKKAIKTYCKKIENKFIPQYFQPVLEEKHCKLISYKFSHKSESCYLKFKYWDRTHHLRISGHSHPGQEYEEKHPSFLLDIPKNGVLSWISMNDFRLYMDKRLNKYNNLEGKYNMTDKEALEIISCECDKETTEFISKRLKLLEEIEENPSLAIQLKQQKFEHLRNRKM